MCSSMPVPFERGVKRLRLCLEELEDDDDELELDVDEADDNELVVFMLVAPFTFNGLFNLFNWCCCN